MVVEFEILCNRGVVGFMEPIGFLILEKIKNGS
jgi:hypothetical protein